MLLKTENEIVQNWKGDQSKPIVSVTCTTYNHEHYIDQAINSFLMQETNFPFEILINDDKSLDQTSNIIRAYQEKYPNIIKPLFQSENQYAKGKRMMVEFNYPRALGKYIAVCEGDDYWTDPLKLQKQFDALEAHPNLNLCLHYAELLDDSNKRRLGKIGKYPVDDALPVVSFEAIIKKEHGQIPTASTFFRTTILEGLYDFFAKSPSKVGDVFLHILGANNQGAYLIKEVMSCYRVNVPGSWNERCGKGGYESHVFERASAFKLLEVYISDEYHKTLQDTVFKSFIFILKTPYASKQTKRKALSMVKHRLKRIDVIFYKILTELNVAHRTIFKIKNLLGIK